jgi:hypothetical protein
VCSQCRCCLFSGQGSTLARSRGCPPLSTWKKSGGSSLLSILILRLRIDVLILPPIIVIAVIVVIAIDIVIVDLPLIFSSFSFPLPLPLLIAIASFSIIFIISCRLVLWPGLYYCYRLASAK